MQMRALTAREIVGSTSANLRISPHRLCKRAHNLVRGDASCWRKTMIRLVTLALIGALAPMLVIGAIGAMIILMTAPVAVVYTFAFVALTPILGLLLWRLLHSMRPSEALGEFVDRVTDLARLILSSKSDRESSDGGTSLPAPMHVPMSMHLGISVVGRGTNMQLTSRPKAKCRSRQL
jgi:hypothetical protein